MVTRISILVGTLVVAVSLLAVAATTVWTSNSCSGSADSPVAGRAPAEAVYPYPGTVNSFDGALTGWTTPQGVALMFAKEEMGWDPQDVDVALGSGDELVAVITNTRVQGLGLPDIPTILMIEAHHGICFVTVAWSEVLRLEPPTRPTKREGAVVFAGVPTIEAPGMEVEYGFIGERGSLIGRIFESPEGGFEDTWRPPHYPAEAIVFVRLVAGRPAGLPRRIALGQVMMRVSRGWPPPP